MPDNKYTLGSNNFESVSDSMSNVADLFAKRKMQEQQLQAEMARQQQAQEAQQSAIDQNTERAHAQAKAMGMQQGKYGVKASATGYDVDPNNDDLAMYLRGEQIKNLQNERFDKSVERLGDARTKSKLPELEAANERAEETLTPERIESAYGGALGRFSSLPIVGGIGRAIQEVAYPKDAEVRSTMEQIKQIPRNAISGANLTTPERESFDLAQGGGILKTPEQITNGKNALKKIMEAKKRSVEGAFNPKTVTEYRKRSGELPIGKQKTEKDLIMEELEELKRQNQE